MDQFTYDFSTRLAAARAVRGMSQAEVAESAGLPPSTISHFERGARLPSLENFRALAQALDADAAWLLFLRHEAAPSGYVERLVRDVDGMTKRDQSIIRKMVEFLRSETDS